MRYWVVLLLLAPLVTATAASAAETPDVEGVVADLESEVTGLVSQGGDEVAPPQPGRDESLVGGLLSGTWQFVKDVGAILAAGAEEAAQATGAALAAVVAATLAAAVAAALAARDAVAWSAIGVFGLMQDALTFLVATLTATLAGAWRLLDGLAVVLAGLRPAAVPQVAWAGGIATVATAASAAAHYGLLDVLRRWGWIGGAGLPLFSRIAKDDLLDHPLRSEIFEAIKASPGIHVSELMRTVDAGWGTTIHHLRKLKEVDLVAVRVVNNQKCFFANGGTVGRSAWMPISHLKNPTARRITEFVHAHPLTPVTEVSVQLGIGASLVSHHVAKLARAGVLEKVRDGRFIRLAVSEEARRLVFPDAPAVTQPVPVGLAA